MSPDSRIDSTVAGMLRKTIALKVAPMVAKANSANSEPITVMPAARPNAR